MVFWRRLLTGRYQIHTKPAPARFTYPAKVRLGDGDDYVKYGHAPFEQGRRGGDAHWTPEIITQTWYQAETGRIPISGAGYGGACAGPGFDSIWLDMSEIVRPTRDGIHGREVISTAVVLGRRLAALQFDPHGGLVSELPAQVEIPIPVLFDPLPMPLPGQAPGWRFCARQPGWVRWRWCAGEWDEPGRLRRDRGAVPIPCAARYRSKCRPGGRMDQAARLIGIDADGRTRRTCWLAERPLRFIPPPWLQCGVRPRSAG
jgi:hypothetical protein